MRSLVRAGQVCHRCAPPPSHYDWLAILGCLQQKGAHCKRVPAAKGAHCKKVPTAKGCPLQKGVHCKRFMLICTCTRIGVEAHHRGSCYVGSTGILT